jgi:protein ImuA
MTDQTQLPHLIFGDGPDSLEHNMNKKEKLADLRHFLAHYALPPDRPSISLGLPTADSILGGGLRRGALHEVFAGDWGAGGFAACLAIQAAGKKPLFWIRPDYEALEYGPLSATGLLELGGDPANLFLLRASHADDALSAAADILACPHVGAVVLEICGTPRCLDLVASRRLSLLAEESGVTLFLLREGAKPEPSAAATRWQVRTLASDPDDDDWGAPRFRAQLTRHRLGPLSDFLLTWDSEHGLFHDAAAHSGLVAAAPADRPAEASRQRRA